MAVRARAAGVGLEQLPARTALEHRALDAGIPRSVARPHSGDTPEHAAGELQLTASTARDQRARARRNAAAAGQLGGAPAAGVHAAAPERCRDSTASMSWASQVARRRCAR